MKNAFILFVEFIITFIHNHHIGCIMFILAVFVGTLLYEFYSYIYKE